MMMTQYPQGVNPPPQTPQPMMPQRELEGATASLVLGIISIVFNAPIVALILAWIGYTKGKAAREEAKRNPGVYSNGGTAEAGYVLSIVGLVLGGLSTLACCGYLGFVGFLMAIAGAGAAAGP